MIPDEKNLTPMMPAALKAFFKRLPPPPAVEAIPSFQAPV